MFKNFPLNKKKYYAVFFLVAVLIASVLYYFVTQTQLFSAITNDKTTEEKPVVPGTETLEDLENIKKAKILKELLAEYLKDRKGTYSIYIKDLKDSQTIKIFPELKFHPASTFKIYTAMLTLKDIEDGKYTKNTILSARGNQDTIDKGIAAKPVSDPISGEGEVELYTSKTEKAISDAIISSSNIAQSMMMNQLSKGNGRQEIVRRVEQELGGKNTTLDPIYTTSEDLGLALEKLYKQEYLNSENSEFLLELLSKSKVKNRIGSGIPSDADITVANKYGSWNGFQHDAAIIFSNKTDYILVILGKNVGTIKNALEVNQNISMAVWEYFQDKQHPKNP